MKHGQRPTRREKEAIQEARLNPKNWLVTKHLTTINSIEIVHRETGTKRTIPA